MERAVNLWKSGGKVEIFEDKEKLLYLARPYGIMNPSLIKADIKEAEKFGKESDKPWTYITDTEHMLFPNILNLYYLRKIKNLPNIKEFAIYVPTTLKKIMLIFASIILRPDIILTNKKEFEDFIHKKLS